MTEFSQVGIRFTANIATRAPKAGVYDIALRRPAPRPAKSIAYLFALATLLFFVLSPGVLKLMDWHYLGGGAEYQKVHIASYMLFTAFVGLWFLDPRFRGNVTELCSDWTLVSFALAVSAIAVYAVLVKHVSITPFVDTFLAALVATVGWISLPLKSLVRLRLLINLYFVSNIVILFFEYGTQSWLISTPFGGPFRAVGFFEGPLSAATLLGVYALANLVSAPIRFTRDSLLRLTLGFASVLAIFTTGGRVAIVVTLSILLIFIVISAARQFASGRINRAVITYGLIGSPVVAIVFIALLQSGFLDTMIGRFEFDQGSAFSRQIALELAANMPTNDVWLGLPSVDLGALERRQAEMNLIAIEISWVNFVLTCGWVLTALLFMSYLLFLFRFIPRYCGSLAILPSIFILILTSASNGIWAKTTVLTTSLAIILAFFRNRSSSEHTYVASATSLCLGHDYE